MLSLLPLFLRTLWDLPSYLWHSWPGLFEGGTMDPWSFPLRSVSPLPPFLFSPERRLRRKLVVVMGLTSLMRLPPSPWALLPHVLTFHWELGDLSHFHISLNQPSYSSIESPYFSFSCHLCVCLPSSRLSSASSRTPSFYFSFHSTDSTVFEFLFISYISQCLCSSSRICFSHPAFPLFPAFSKSCRVFPIWTWNWKLGNQSFAWRAVMVLQQGHWFLCQSPASHNTSFFS